MTDIPDDKRDFFVSFNQADRAWATWIAWTLEAAGYSVFFQDWDFKGNFVLEMDKAHTRSRRSIAVLSPTYLTSRFTAPEWAARFAQDATSEHDLLIPIRVRPCELEGLLAQIVYVDLVGCGEETARDRLVRRVEGIRLKPDEPPLFPGEIGHAAVAERPAFPAAALPTRQEAKREPETAMREKTGEGQSGGINIGGSVGYVGGSIVGRDQITGVPSAAALDDALRPLIEAVRDAPAEKRAEAEAKLAALKQEAAKGKSAADDKVMAKLVDGLVGLVPGAASAVVSAFATPLLGGIAGPVTDFVLDKLRGK